MRLLKFLRKIPAIYGWLSLIIVFLPVVIPDSSKRDFGWSRQAAFAGSPGLGSTALWGQSLWDWRTLLVFSLALALGAFLFYWLESRRGVQFTRETKASDLQTPRENPQEAEPDNFIEAMTALLLDKKTEPTDEEKEAARIKTLATLQRLDAPLKTIAMGFLIEAELVQSEDLENPPLVNLSGADLEGADLYGANLGGARLNGANLMRTKLRVAYLGEANLDFANLKGADLGGAGLEGASLRFANLREANLMSAKLEGAGLEGANLEDADLRGATLPDGKEYNETTDLGKFTNPDQEEAAEEPPE